MGKVGFTDEQVDLAIDYVVKNGATDRGQTVAYTRVFEAAGLPPPQDLHSGGESEAVSKFMEQFHRRCRDLSYPPLDSLVVHVAGGREGHPGAGYFRVNGLKDPFGEHATAEQVMEAFGYWEVERDKCRRWGERKRRGQV